MNMLTDIKKFIADNNLIKPSDRILLALSGGIDSMVMADLFQQLGYFTGIIHCNFMLRDNESFMDEEFVKNYAEKYGITFFTKRFDTKKFANTHGLSIQMAARELRYPWFEEIRINNGFNSIAVAHNLNDNIETLLINLVRGTGINGMTGMKPSVNNVIRPLLFATRDHIANYCEQKELKFREDRSNADTKYTRNKIRHLVIPVLKEINPSIEYTLNETAERFTGINEVLTEYMYNLREKISEQEGDLISLNINLLKKHCKNSTILYELFKQYGLTNVQLIDLRKVIDGKTGGQIYTDTHRILKNRSELIISAESKENSNSYQIEILKDFKKVPSIASAILTDIDQFFQIPSDPSVACIDLEKIKFPLTIRNWKPGDYFYPLGMKQRKKLSDYFIDNKYSIIEKESILILESDAKIVWLIGDRIDNRFKISKSTKIALTIKSTNKPLIIKPLR